MHIDHLKFVACPATLENLELEVIEQNAQDVITGRLVAKSSKRNYTINKGIADFVYPDKLKELDREFEEKYNTNASYYDEGMAWLFASFFEEEKNVRTKLVNLLSLKPSHTVLNLGCGTGSDSVFIQELLSNEGKLFNLDLTSGLLKIAKQKLGASSANLDYFLGNGSYLPFQTNTFDAVFHFGGINMFSEKKRAITEMARVVKPGGRVVFGDESVAPWLNNKQYGKIIKNANPLYKHKPPMHLLPPNAQDVSLHYLLGNSFYVISFKAGEISKLNLDLPIPGKRGGTLRSRYEAARMK
jgi:ubiquinone/menaquinone biosynthesis C-methylase UbiE